MEDRVHVRVGFDVVQPDETGVVGLLLEVVGGGGAGVDGAEELGGEGWVEEIFDVVERGVVYFVTVGEDIDLFE